MKKGKKRGGNDENLITKKPLLSNSFIEGKSF